MTIPVTELDERYSEADTTAVPWPEVERLIDTAQLFWITTVRPDGRPHSTPLVAVWLDGALHVCTGADEQKGRNLAENPQVLLTTGCNDWQSGVDVIVEGVAERVTDRARLERLAQAWTSKWDGRWQFEPSDEGFGGAGHGTALVYAVAPSVVYAHGKNPFTHTRYRFA